MDISIILVNYCSFELTFNCINSIKEHTAKSINYEIIVVDNNSPDNSGERLLDTFQDCKIILNTKNSGFGSANNLGLKNAQGKYVLFLNTDTILLNDALSKFFTFAENYKGKLGCLGAWLFQADQVSRGTSKCHFFSKKYIVKLIIRETLSLIFNKDVKINHFTPKIQKEEKLLEVVLPKEISFVDAVIGADMFMLTSVIREIGCFDEKFFLYSEEADVSQRLKANGYDRVLISGPKIVHLEGATTSQHKTSRFIRKQKIYSSARYLIKYFLKI